MTTTQNTQTFRPFAVGDPVVYDEAGPGHYKETHGTITELVDGGTALVDIGGLTVRKSIRSLSHRGY